MVQEFVKSNQRKSNLKLSDLIVKLLTNFMDFLQPLVCVWFTALKYST